MDHGIDRRARSRKAKGGLRALFGKAPPAAEVGDRLARLARRMLKGAVADVSPKRVTLDLHPNAAPLRIAVLPDGDLEVRGDTSALGPGYHADALARLTPVLDELDYVWADDGADPEAMLTAWLAEALRAGETRIGMPGERAFFTDAPIQTALGPRDEAWRDAVLADPRRGADAFAWWSRGKGQAERSRALLAMWHEVPWRPPLGREERDLMKGVDADLRAARGADPDIDLPYGAWAELAVHLGDEERASELVDLARDDEPAIGYRRYDLEADLGDGWSMRMPGSFLAATEDDGARFVATDGSRAVEVTMIATTERDSAALLAVAPERFPVVERIAEGARVGRAEAHDEGELRVVHGLVAVAPHVAILTCKGTPADEPWMLATWRSLTNKS